jgi:hypothetical protein
MSTLRPVLESLFDYQEATNRHRGANVHHQEALTLLYREKKWNCRFVIDNER